MSDDPLVALERQLVDAARRLMGRERRRAVSIGAIVSAVLALGAVVLAILSVVLAHQ